MRLAEISLTKWRTQKVFVGLEAGHTCREFFKLDELDKVGTEITVTIPGEVYISELLVLPRDVRRLHQESRQRSVPFSVSLRGKGYLTDAE